MTLINALPFDGVSISSETWRRFQKHMLQPMGSSTLNDGVYYTPWTGQFKVARVSATQVSVQSGSGMANGLPFWSDAATNLPVAAAHATYTRYDFVVVRVNFLDKETRVTLLQGTPAASPVAPSLQKTGAPYYDVPLAVLTVAPGSGVSTVADRREFISGASSVQRVVRNADATTLLPGHIVAWSEFNPIDVVLTNQASSVWTAGVIETAIAPGGFGLMTEYGVGRVKINMTRGPGSRFGTSATPGFATERANNYVATLLESGSNGDVVRAWIDTTQLRDPIININRNIQQQTTLTNPEPIEGFNTNIFLRYGGRLLLTFLGLTYISVGSGIVIYQFEVDGVRYGVFTSDVAVADLWKGCFSTSFIVDNLAAGQHNVRVNWNVNTAGTTAILRGEYFTTRLVGAVI